MRIYILRGGGVKEESATKGNGRELSRESSDVTKAVREDLVE